MLCTCISMYEHVYIKRLLQSVCTVITLTIPNIFMYINTYMYEYMYEQNLHQPVCTADELAVLFLTIQNILVVHVYVIARCTMRCRAWAHPGRAVGRALCLEYRVSWVPVPPETKVTALGVLCCFVLLFV